MTAVQVNDLAFQYAEFKFVLARTIGSNYYKDAAEWFKLKGGNQEDYSVFIDLVHVWTKNRYDLLLSDAYCNFPEWR